MLEREVYGRGDLAFKGESLPLISSMSLSIISNTFLISQDSNGFFLLSSAIWYERIWARKTRMVTCNAISGESKCNSSFWGDHGWVGIEITPLILPYCISYFSLLVPTIIFLFYWDNNRCLFIFNVSEF
jgi:hypothetical protein